jgi:hypothetical protein
VSKGELDFLFALLELDEYFSESFDSAGSGLFIALGRDIDEARNLLPSSAVFHERLHIAAETALVRTIL